MAAQVYEPQTVFQPTQPSSPGNLAAPFQQASAAAEQAAGEATQAARMYAGASVSQLQQANAYFDQTLATYNKYAMERANEDAAGIIKRDGQGQLIAPSSFYPKGIYSAAYSESFHKAAVSTYREAAANDYQNYGAEMRQTFGNDPVAFKEAMDKKKDAMLANLDESQRPYMELRFNQITSQGSSQIAVAQQAEQHRVNLMGAEDQYEGIVADGQRLVGTQYLVGAPAKDSTDKLRGLLEGNDPNVAMLRDRITDWEAKAKRAGMSEPLIQRKKEEFGYQIWLKTQSEYFRDRRFIADQQGRVDMALVADQQEKIRNIAKTYPGREAQIEQKLTADLNYAQGISQMRAQSTALAYTRQNEATDRSAMRDRIGIEQLRQSGDAEGAKAAELKALDTATAIINNPATSDAAAVRAAGSYMQVGLVGRQVFDEVTNNRIGNLVTTARSSTANDDTRERVGQELVRMASDPNVTRYLSASQVAGIQNGIDTIAGIKTNQEYAGVLMAATSGVRYGDKMAYPSPDFFEKWAGDMYDKGRIGPLGHQVSPAQVAHAVALGTKNYADQQARRSQAVAQVEDIRAGKPGTEDGRKAYAAEVPWNNKDGALRFDGANPAEQDRAVAWTFNGGGDLPGPVKHWYTEMPSVGDPRAFAPYHDMTNKIRAQLKSQFGLEGKDAEAKLGTMIGANQARTLAAQREFGDKATNVTMEGLTGTSKTANSGQPPSSGRNEVDSAMDRFLSGLREKSEQGTVIGRIGAARLGGTAAELTPQELAAKQFFDANPNADAMSPGVFSPKVAYDMDPAVRTRIAARANMIIANHGKDIAPHAQRNNETIEDYAVRQAMFEDGKLFSPVRVKNADGTEKIQLQLTPLDRLLEQRMGPGASMGGPEMKGFLQAYLRMKNPEVLKDRDMNWDTLTAKTDMESGELSYRITVENRRTGTVMLLGKTTPDDPLLDATRLKITDQADKEMRKNWRILAGANDGLSTFVGATIANATIGLLNDTIRGNKIGSIARAQEEGRWSTWWGRQLGNTSDYLYGVDGDEIGKTFESAGIEARREIRAGRDTGRVEHIRRYGPLMYLLENLSSGMPSARQSRTVPPGTTTQSPRPTEDDAERIAMESPSYRPPGAR